jgi:putative sterol carrier protein
VETFKRSIAGKFRSFSSALRGRKKDDGQEQGMRLQTMSSSKRHEDVKSVYEVAGRNYYAGCMSAFRRTD